MLTHLRGGARQFAWWLFLLATVATAPVAPAADSSSTNANLAQLADMDINQLLQVKVSILGPSQTVSKTPAAVSVVTQDDIQR